jgi:hypothetical protein
MQLNSQERRMMRRFDMRLPAIVRLEGLDEFHTETQNVSARGVYFYLDRAVDSGTKIEVTLTFPPHITLTDPVRVRFMARVIRVESPLPSLRIGTAAMIENYEFLRSGGTVDFFSALQSKAGLGRRTSGVGPQASGTLALGVLAACEKFGGLSVVYTLGASPRSLAPKPCLPYLFHFLMELCITADEAAYVDSVNQPSRDVSRNQVLD